MTIEAQLPDGTTLQFPDGTPDAVVTGAVKQHLSANPISAPQTPEAKLGLTPAPPEKPKPAPIEDPSGGSEFGEGGPYSWTAGTPQPQTAAAPQPDPIRPGPLTLDAPSLEFHPFAGARPGALGRIGQAADEGARAVPPLPRVPDSVLGVAPLVNPLISGLEGGIRLGGGLFRGGQQAVAETVDPMFPGLGRDIVSLPEAFAGSPNALHPMAVPEPPGPRIAPPTGRYVGEFYGDRSYPGAPPGPSGGGPSFVPPGTLQSVQLNQLLDAVRAVDQKAANKPAFVPPTTSTSVTGEVTPIVQPRIPAEAPAAATPAPEAPPAAPGPASAGAAASREGTPASQVGLTPQQAAAAGSTADKQWLYKTITPGEADNTEYVRGITPTMAQREQTVNAARDAKDLRNLSPEADQNERALLSEHSDLRKDEFQKIAGSDVTQQADLKAADDQIDKSLTAAYAHGGTVDLQPVVDQIGKELAGSGGKLPPVQAAMKQVTDALQKPDGSGLESSPIEANKARRLIIYLQSKQGQLANPGYGAPDVMAALTRAKDVLTKQIEPAAPGFTDAITNYAKARQAIDAREALQAYEPKLYQPVTGNMQFAPFHRLMNDVVQSRDPNAPLNPYKALTEDQMNRLKSLHDDLQRAASAQELAKAAGSDTAQNLAGLARRAIQHGAGGAIGTAVGLGATSLFGPHVGVPAGMFAKGAADYLFSQRAVARATAEHNRLLRPDATAYPMKPNPLMQPPEAP